MDVVVDGHRRRAGAVSETVDRLQRKLFIGAGFVEVDAENLLGMLFQRFGIHGLAGLCAADTYRVFARRRGAKIMIKTDDAVDFGLGKTERCCNVLDRVLRNITQSILNAVENRQQVAGHGFMGIQYVKHDRFLALIILHHELCVNGENLASYLIMNKPLFAIRFEPQSREFPKD